MLRKQFLNILSPSHFVSFLGNILYEYISVYPTPLMLTLYVTGHGAALMHIITKQRKPTLNTFILKFLASGSVLI